jgi:uncharacterized cupredoxin-like copper-binding protein
VRGRRAVAVVAAAVLVPLVGGFALDAAWAARRAAPQGPGLVTIELRLRYSRFSPSQIDVYQGTLVRFVVVNDDPIHHELVVGPPEVHAHHEMGHERRHGPVPGEVSVGAHERNVTVYRFAEVGPVRFACHLQGHAGYGMVGVVDVHPVPVD